MPNLKISFFNSVYITIIIHFSRIQFFNSLQIALQPCHPMIWFLLSVTMVPLVVVIIHAIPSIAKVNTGLNLMISMSLKCHQKLCRTVRLMFCSTGIKLYLLLFFSKIEVKSFICKLKNTKYLLTGNHVIR